ncbi:Serine/arginine repetitive matrix protein 1 [Thoreauomyces humboldtii]|nr:Serine/arginine repetitive matrix protein 1 [Thoreauomyces humboldtii]
MGDAGFFKGTSSEQDSRFGDKQRKLLKSMKFPKIFDTKVDMKKVNLTVIRPWVTTKIISIVGFEDDVLIEFVFNLLEAEKVDPRTMQIEISGFLESNAPGFMKELWGLLVSAQSSIGGIPQLFLDQKKDEISKKRAEDDEIRARLLKLREKEAAEKIDEAARRKAQEAGDIPIAICVDHRDGSQIITTGIDGIRLTAIGTGVIPTKSANLHGIVVATMTITVAVTSGVAEDMGIRTAVVIETIDGMTGERTDPRTEGTVLHPDEMMSIAQAETSRGAVPYLFLQGAQVEAITRAEAVRIAEARVIAVGLPRPFVIDGDRALTDSRMKIPMFHRIDSLFSHPRRGERQNVETGRLRRKPDARSVLGGMNRLEGLARRRLKTGNLPKSPASCAR